MNRRIEVWDARHAEGAPAEVAWVLREHAHLLPSKGEALDLACGLGANALFLAECGLATTAWDFSSVAIERLDKAAAARGLSIQSVVRDVVASPPAPGTFDIIVISHFLDRTLVPHLIEALRPGGLLFYQTFTTERPEGGATPSNPAFLLAPNELLKLFAGLRVMAYREDGLAGDMTRGLRALAALVVMKS